VMQSSKDMYRELYLVMDDGHILVRSEKLACSQLETFVFLLPPIQVRGTEANALKVIGF